MYLDTGVIRIPSAESRTYDMQSPSKTICTKTSCMSSSGTIFFRCSVFQTHATTDHSGTQHHSQGLMVALHRAEKLHTLPNTFARRCVAGKRGNEVRITGEISVQPVPHHPAGLCWCPPPAQSIPATSMQPQCDPFA